MLNNVNKYTQKSSKLKRFSKKSFYRKIWPTSIAKDIPDNLITKTGYTKRLLIKDLWKLIDCSKSLSYVKGYYKKGEQLTDFIKMFNSNFCNIFVICPSCGEKVGRHRRKKYEQKIKECSEKYPNKYMLTFTTRAETTFEASYENLRKSLRKFTLMGQMRGADVGTGKLKRSGGEASKIKAMLLSIEIKKSEDNKLWHVHAHAIAFTDELLNYHIYDQGKKNKITEEIKNKCHRKPRKAEWIPAIIEHRKMKIIKDTGLMTTRMVPVSKLSREWLKATGATSINIKVNPMKGDPESIFRQCIEIMKYTAKVSDFSKNDIVELLMNRKGKRYFSAFGDFYDMDLQESKEKRAMKKEDSENENEEEREFVHDLDSFVWSNKANSLVPIHGNQKKEIYDKYKLKDKLWLVQANIMKAYYIKESISKEVTTAFFKEVKKQGIKIDPLYRTNIVKMLDDLENAYEISKRRIYKEHMRFKARGYDKVIKPTPIQKRFLSAIKHLFKETDI